MRLLTAHLIVGSVLCASAPVSEVFILGRAIAGIGAAGLLQGALGIITFISPLEKRPIAMASVISVFGISCSMGPVLGGVFVDRVSWRWCFWVNLPIGLAAFLLVVFSLHLKQIAAIPERQQSLVAKLKKVDVIGITLIIGFVACLCIVLQDGGNTAPWNSARVIGLLVAAVVIKALFWFSQWKLGERALIPVRFLTNRTVAFGSIFLFLDNMSNYLVSSHSTLACRS
jgi:MFS family permease